MDPPKKTLHKVLEIFIILELYSRCSPSSCYYHLQSTSELYIHIKNVKKTALCYHKILHDELFPIHFFLFWQNRHSSHSFNRKWSPLFYKTTKNSWIRATPCTAEFWNLTQIFENICDSVTISVWVISQNNINYGICDIIQIIRCIFWLLLWLISMYLKHHYGQFREKSTLN